VWPPVKGRRFSDGTGDVCNKSVHRFQSGSRLVGTSQIESDSLSVIILSQMAVWTHRRLWLDRDRLCIEQALSFAFADESKDSFWNGAIDQLFRD
jgi:hypothetical protein